MSITTAERAHLLAVSECKSGLWFQVLPSPNIDAIGDTTCLRLSGFVAGLCIAVSAVKLSITPDIIAYPAVGTQAE